MATLTESLKNDIAHISDLKRSSVGDLDTISGLSNVKIALFHRLVTSPGSLIHRPNYGVGIKDFQNAPNSLTAYRQLALRIREQFEQDPRVQSVQSVRIEEDGDNPFIVNLLVRVKIVGYDEAELKFTPFSEGV